MRSLMWFVVGAALCGCASSGTPSPDLAPASRTSTQTIVGAGGGSAALNLVNDANALSTEIAAPVDVTWNALQSVYASLEIPLSMRDEQKKTLGNSAFRTRRRIGPVPMIRALDCGGESGMPNAETYDITMEITSLVTPGAPGRTRLQTLVQASAQRATGGNNNPVRCSSIGGLEEKISEMVQKIVAGK